MKFIQFIFDLLHLIHVILIECDTTIFLSLDHEMFLGPQRLHRLVAGGGPIIHDEHCRFIWGGTILHEGIEHMADRVVLVVHLEPFIRFALLIFLSPLLCLFLIECQISLCLDGFCLKTLPSPAHEVDGFAIGLPYGLGDRWILTLCQPLRILPPDVLHGGEEVVGLLLREFGQILPAADPVDHVGELRLHPVLGIPRHLLHNIIGGAGYVRYGLGHAVQILDGLGYHGLGLIQPCGRWIHGRLHDTPGGSQSPVYGGCHISREIEVGGCALQDPLHPTPGLLNVFSIELGVEFGDFIFYAEVIATPLLMGCSRGHVIDLLFLSIVRWLFGCLIFRLALGWLFGRLICFRGLFLTLIIQ